MDSGFRTSTISLLESLRDLDPMVGPVELCCGWFDDLYHPGNDAWEASFCSTEKLALAKFNAAFSAVERDISQDFQDFPQDATWQLVSHAARTALKALEPAA